MTTEQKQQSLTATKVGMAGDVMIVLTMIASFSYDLGALAVVLPPAWKPYVTGAGTVATVVLFLVKRFYELRSKAS